MILYVLVIVDILAPFEYDFPFGQKAEHCSGKNMSFPQDCVWISEVWLQAGYLTRNKYLRLHSLTHAEFL